MHTAICLQLWAMRYTSESGTSGMCHIVELITSQGHSHASLQNCCHASKTESFQECRAPHGIDGSQQQAMIMLPCKATQSAFGCSHRPAASAPHTFQDETNWSSACRDSFRPVLQVGLPQRWRFAVQWLADPAGLLVAEDEGALRWTSLDPFFRRERMPINSVFESVTSYGPSLQTYGCPTPVFRHSLHCSFWRECMLHKAS